MSPLQDIYVFGTLYVSWFNRGAQTPLVEYSKVMMCLLYGTEGSHSNMITGSKGVFSPAMKLFSFDGSYNFAESDSIFRKRSQVVQLSKKQTYENMKTSFVVFALIMLLVAISGAQASSKPRLYISRKNNV